MESGLCPDGNLHLKGGGTSERIQSHIKAGSVVSESKIDLLQRLHRIKWEFTV